jgi:hypothetical protein
MAWDVAVWMMSLRSGVSAIEAARDRDGAEQQGHESGEAEH